MTNDAFSGPISLQLELNSS